jgi:uncharacterized protein (TIGR02271 family)
MQQGDSERNEGGIWGALTGMFMPDEDSHVYAEGLHRGHAMLIVRAAPAEQDRIISLLDTQNPLDVDTHAAQWRQSGWSGTYAGAQSRATQASSTATTGTARTGATEEVIPVYEEQLRVGKREVERGTVRVRSYVVETPVEQQIQLRDERVEIERRAVDRPVTAAELGSDAFRERTIDVTTHREEAVVDKEARVKEEIVVRKEADEHTETGPSRDWGCDGGRVFPRSFSDRGWMRGLDFEAGGNRGRRRGAVRRRRGGPLTPNFATVP